MEESIPQGKVAFFSNLPYGDTVWGKFYANYKSFDFDSLRRKLNAEGRKMNIMREHIASHPEDKFKEMQKIFKGVIRRTLPSGDIQKLTPEALLILPATRDKSHRKAYIESKLAFGAEVYRQYCYRHRKEHTEILEYYVQQKDLNQQRVAIAEQAEKTRRNGRAAEKIQCERCMQMISRGGKSAHMKTKKCMESTNP